MTKYTLTVPPEVAEFARIAELETEVEFWKSRCSSFGQYARIAELEARAERAEAAAEQAHKSMVHWRAEASDAGSKRPALEARAERAEGIVRKISHYIITETLARMATPIYLKEWELAYAKLDRIWDIIRNDGDTGIKPMSKAVGTNVPSATDQEATTAEKKVGLKILKTIKEIYGGRGSI